MTNDQPVSGKPVGVNLGAFLLVIGFVAFGAGLAQFFKLAIEDTSGKDRPVVTAELLSGEIGLVLKASVSAAGLRSDEHVEILVQGLNSRTELSDVVAGPGARQRDDVPNYRDSPTEFDSPQRLYLSRVGGDRNGDVEAMFAVPISVGLYERLRIVATVTSKDPTQDENQRIQDQKDKGDLEDEVSAKKRGYAEHGASAALSLIAYALASDGSDLVEAARTLTGQQSGTEAGSGTSEESTLDVADGAADQWAIAAERALLAARDQRYQAFANALNDAVQSPEEMESGALTELIYIQCLAEEQQGSDLGDGGCAELVPMHLEDDACSLSMDAGEDPTNRLIELGESCVPDYQTIMVLAGEWSQAVVDRESDIPNDEELLRAVVAAGRLRELEENLTNSFEEDLREAQDCNEEILITGCVMVLLPDAQVRPTIGISIASGDSGPAVDVSVRASEVADGDSVGVVVAAGTNAEDAMPTMIALIGSDGSGSVDETYRIPLLPSQTYVCAVSSITRSALTPARGPGVSPELRIGLTSEEDGSEEQQSAASASPGPTETPVCLVPSSTSAFFEFVVPPPTATTTTTTTMPPIAD